MVMGSAIPENETLPREASLAAGVPLSDMGAPSHKGVSSGPCGDEALPVKAFEEEAESCHCGSGCRCQAACADEEDTADDGQACSCGSARKCLVTGEVAVKAAMIRLARAPSGMIVPDLSEKLPGRGFWVLARRSVLQDAIKKNPFNRVAGTACLVPSDLASQVETLLVRRCLDTLGLAKSAGALVLGQPQVEEALRKNALACVLLAADAGGDVRKKLARAPLIEAPFGREELGGAVGREALVCLGLRPHPLGARLAADLLRLSGVMDEKAASKTELFKTTNGDSERS